MTARWFLTKQERGNPATRVDEQHPGDEAWSHSNEVTALVHGAAYFAELHRCLEATTAGDLVLFTDWQGDADERLIGEPGSEVVDVLGRADERGVDVRGLMWRSHSEKLSFTARENRTLGEELQERGAEVLLDMRVRAGGSHHQKFVVIRYRGRPEEDVAFIGGIDLAHNRRDDARHLGDPQSNPMSQEYGATPPWHDAQVAIRGPAVHDVETVFRERWEDPLPLSRNPLSRLRDKLRRDDTRPDPLPAQAAPPPVAGEHPVQLLRTYPRLDLHWAHAFAPDGERSVARGYRKAVGQAQQLVYLEDQYLWGREMADVFATALERSPQLRVIAVVPLVPEADGALVQDPQNLGRMRALGRLMAVAPGRVAAYGIENREGTPVYVHAKVCVVDDTWTTVGSDNFNRRSWTHDSELTAAVLSPGFARSLRLELGAEHLDGPVGDDMFADFASSARQLDAWHAGGRLGERPPGRLRGLRVPSLSRPRQLWASVPYRLLHDPDGRSWRMRLRGEF